MTTYGKEAWQRFVANSKKRWFIFTAIIVLFVIGALIYLAI